MNALLEIEQAVSQLPQNDLAAFRKWFAQFDASAWDAQFESDVMAGKLNALAEEALRHLKPNDESRTHPNSAANLQKNC